MNVLVRALIAVIIFVIVTWVVRYLLPSPLAELIGLAAGLWYFFGGRA